MIPTRLSSIAALRGALATSLCAGLLAAFASPPSTARAAEQVVTQKNKRFSAQEITLKKGDSLVFENDDTVTHNVYSATKGNEFDVGDQKPGQSSKVKFDKAGEFSVRCAVHPGMKLKVVVKE